MKKLILIFLLLFATLAYGQLYEKAKPRDSNDRYSATCYRVKIENTNPNDPFNYWISTHITLVDKTIGETTNIPVYGLIHMGDGQIDTKLYRVLIVKFSPDGKYLLFSSRRYNHAYDLETKKILSTSPDFKYQLVDVIDNELEFYGIGDEHNEGIPLLEKKVKRVVTLEEIYRIIK